MSWEGSSTPCGHSGTQADSSILTQLSNHWGRKNTVLTHVLFLKGHSPGATHVLERDRIGIFVNNICHRWYAEIMLIVIVKTWESVKAWSELTGYLHRLTLDRMCRDMNYIFNPVLCVSYAGVFKLHPPGSDGGLLWQGISILMYLKLLGHGARKRAIWGLSIDSSECSLPILINNYLYF